MTRDELLELDRLTQLDPAKGQAYLQTLSRGHKNRLWGSDDHKYFVPARPEGDVDNLIEDIRRSTQLGKAAADSVAALSLGLAHLFTAAGIVDAARELRDRSGMPAEHAAWYPREEDFQTAAAAHKKHYPSGDHPDAQMAACLRLHRTITDPAFVVRGAVDPLTPLAEPLAGRMQELMLAYPALLHPSICWFTDVFSQPNAMLPLVQKLLNAEISWPRITSSSAHPITEARMTTFACNRVLELALTTPAHCEPSYSSVYAPGRDATALEFLEQRCRMEDVTSLLQIERLRAKAGLSPIITWDLSTAETAVVINKTFGEAWEQSTSADGQAYLGELAALPVAGSDKFNRALLYTVSCVLATPDDAFIAEFAPDYLDRLSRMAGALMAAGATKTPKESAYAITSVLFQDRSHPTPVCIAEAPDTVPIECAMRFICAIEQMGQPREDTISMIRKASYPYPSFLAAAQALTVEKSMRSAMDVAAGTPDDSIAARPRRAGL